jgi:hypothetical protein
MRLGSAAWRFSVSLFSYFWSGLVLVLVSNRV